MCCSVGAALSAGSLKPSWTAGSAEASSAGATGMSGAEAITDSAGLLLIVKLEPQDNLLVGQAQKYMILFQIFRLCVKSLCIRQIYILLRLKELRDFPLMVDNTCASTQLVFLCRTWGS